MIEVTELRYQYPAGQSPALIAPRWCVGEGEFVLLAGTTGSGKTTLLRSLVSLVPHFYGGWFGGRVVIAGRDTRSHRPADLADLVGYVSQEPEAQTLLDRVADEVAFALENLGYSSGAVAARVEEALDLLGIAHLRERPIESLSGGERQRVTLAAALALRPRLLLLDEPTSQLDPWAAESVLEVLRRLVDELGVTVILAEHRLDRLLGSATRLTVMDKGHLVADGPPAETAAFLPDPPLLVQLSQALGWSPPALTVADAKRRLARASFPSRAKRHFAGGEVILTLEGVTCQRGDRVVLRDIDVVFRRGSVTVIVGRNGAGKTTLVRAALGLEPVQRGRVRLFGHEPGEPAFRKRLRSVAYVPQFPGALLLATRLADDLELARRSRECSHDAVQAMVDMFELAPLLSAHPFDLSSGERQRAALALALLGNPELIVLDEPTRGLSLTVKRRLAKELRQRAAGGATVIVTTHDVDFAAAVADRVLLLGNGTAIAEGPPEQVLGESFAYAPLISRIFGPAFLDLEDVLQVLAATSPPLDRPMGYTLDVDDVDGIRM